MRLILPPYAKALQRERDQGRHPWEVFVAYSRTWRVRLGESLEPYLFVPADDYQPGTYEFSVLAGLPVHLVLFEQDDRVAALAAEIGRYAAPVLLYYRAGDGRLSQRELAEWLFCQRWVDAQGWHWPVGWNDALDLAYAERCEQVFAFYTQRPASAVA